MEDVASYLFAAPEDIDPQQLAFTSGRIAFQRFLEHLNQPTSG
jgi:hypothetical protein